ncbi:MAG: efflux RND transporter permease subunit [Acidobacteria bacterium]|nr:efflux RND transporter permease subunit [Acidobacteriota bacterium]
MNLSEFSIKYPVTICMALVCFMVLGTISIIKIPVELLPEVDFPHVQVFVPYPNASPEQVEQTITKPLEEALATVPHVRSLNSYSSADTSAISLEFDWGLDIDMIRAEIREKVEQARVELPDDVDHIYVRNFRSSDIPIIEGRISSGRDLRGSYDFLEQRIKKPLERVKGVADVEIGGVARREISIYLRLDDIKKYRVDVGRLFRRMDDANLNVSLGRVLDQGMRFGVLANNELDSLGDISNFPVNERGLRLRDIADIEYAEPPLDYGRHLNGDYAIAVEIRKTSDSNIVDTVARVHEKIEEINSDPSLEGIRLLIWHDSGREITRAISGLLEAGLWGALLAVVVLFLFLRRIGATLAVGFAIPFSIVAAMGFLYLLGKTLNVLSMMGLMLSAGMLVDNAVVVLESIFRNREKGHDHPTAARIGTKEVIKAVVAATLTSVIIFVPLVFGQQTEFSTWLGEVGIAIIITLCCSLFISLTLIPLGMARFLHIRPPKKESTKTWLARSYGRMLDWTMRHRGLTIGAIVLVVFSAAVPFSMLPDTTPQSLELRDLRIRYDFSENYHYAKIEADYVNRVEEVLFANREKWKIRDVYSYYDNSGASTQVYFREEDITPEELEKIREDMAKNLPVVPGADISLGRQRGADNSNWIGANIYGEDTRTLNRFIAQAKSELKKNPLIKEIYTPEEQGREEVQVRLNRDVAGKYGINPQQIGGILAIVLRGREVRGFHGSDGEVEIWIKLRPEDREDLDDLYNIVVSGRDDGRDILLSSVAEFTIVKTPQTIEREDRRTRAMISIIYSGENRDDGIALMRQTMDKLVLPPGYTWSFDRWVAEHDRSDQEFLFNMLLALFMVYFVMASLFESLAHPFAIMFSLPFAFVGVAWFLLITHTPFNFMAQIGILILIGVVVNNGIVLIDHVNNLRRDGLPRWRALREGCLERLRPILMTAATTVMGLTPLALGTTSIFGARYFPMARTVMGGLMASTFLTLLVLPTIYTLIDDFALWIRRLWLETRPTRKAVPVEVTVRSDS